MRVLAFNVQGFRAGGERIAEMIRATDPDVALLTETRRRPMRALARATGRHIVFAAARRFRGEGTAILARAPLHDARRLRFAPTAGFERRCMVAARAAEDVLFVALHLGLSGAERARHAAELIAALPASDRIVIGGDLNEPPGGNAYALLAAAFTDVFASAGEGSGETFPADAPLERIDFVFCSRSLTPVRAAIVPLVASDHLAVVAEIGRRYEASSESAS